MYARGGVFAGHYSNITIDVAKSITTDLGGVLHIGVLYYSTSSNIRDVTGDSNFTKNQSPVSWSIIHGRESSKIATFSQL